MAGAQANQQVTGHFIVHWGVPTELHVCRPLTDGLPFAVMEFPPTGERTSYRFATNGMCAALQGDDDRVRTELFASSIGRHSWIIELLDALARYPIRNATCLREFDTISVGPIDRDHSPFAAVLLAPPGSEEKDTLGAIAAGYGEPTLVHQVVGIFEDECELAIDEGGEELWRRLSAARRPLPLDGERRSIA